MHWRWRLGAVVLVLLAFALVSGSQLCGVALEKVSDPGTKPIGSSGLACAEFWLNRYQALIAALIAGAIAFWAGAIVLRQTRATEMQVAAQRYDFLDKRIQEHQGILRAANDIINILMSSLHPIVNIRIYAEPSWAAGSLMSMAECPIIDFIAKIEEAQSRVSNLKSTIDSFTADQNIVENAIIFCTNVTVYLHGCRTDAYGPVNNLGMGPQSPPPPFRQRSENTQHEYQNVIASFDRMQPIVENEVSLLRARREDARLAAV